MSIIDTPGAGPDAGVDGSGPPSPRFRGLLAVLGAGLIGLPPLIGFWDQPMPAWNMVACGLGLLILALVARMMSFGSVAAALFAVALWLEVSAWIFWFGFAAFWSHELAGVMVGVPAVVAGIRHLSGRS